MTDTPTDRYAPDRIWAQDANPIECNFIGGGWWDDTCGRTQYPHVVEYVRADIHQALLAERDALRDKLEDAVAICRDYQDWSKTWGMDKNANAAETAATECADKISTLIDKETDNE